MSKQIKTEQALSTEVARLESLNDQVMTELTYINGLLLAVGFSKGIESLKESAEDMLEDNEG